MRKLVGYEVLKEQGIVTNRMAIKRAIERRGFPKPFRLGDRHVAWDLEEVEKWLESRRGLAPTT